jgi:hypothetical protein
MFGRRAAHVIGPGTLVLMLVGCGGGDTQIASPATEADLAAYCDAVVAVETVPPPNIDTQSLSKEEAAEASREFVSTTLRPLADRLLALAPLEVAQAYMVQAEALAEAEKTGDMTTPFQTREVQAAVDTAHQFDIANCDWSVVNVTTADYAYEGVPSTLKPGVATFNFENPSDNDESHQMLIVRKNKGVTQSIEKLLTLDPEEARKKLTFVAGTFADPGNDDYIVTRLEPGDYAVVCLLPLESGEENSNGTAALHASEGEIAEFTVE